MDYDPRWRDALDDLSLARGLVQNDDAMADWSKSYAAFPGSVAYVWHAGNKAHKVAEQLIAAGFDIRTQIIWAKPHFVISRGHYHTHTQHEPCWYAVRAGKQSYWAGDRKQPTVWQIANALFQGKGDQEAADKYKTGHGTQKPVECMRRPIENNSSPGQAVYDPFLGSGTTVIAAEQIGRCCLALEISPAYVDVCVERWQNFTGQDAVLDGDGRTFAQIAAAHEPEESDERSVAI